MTILGALAVLALTALPGVLAQTTNATCLSSYSFLYNSKGQSPCLVAAYAAGACTGGQFEVSALDTRELYTGPSMATADTNICLCSSIVYSLMSACGMCQNRPWLTWNSWDTNCKIVYLTVYPKDISEDTAIPAWAYANVSVSGAFDPNVAMAQSSSESTASLHQVTPTSLGTASLNPTHTGSASVKSSNTGAIAGGVVGGVVLVAIASLAFFLVHQRIRKGRNMVGPTHRFSVLPDTPGLERSFTGRHVNGGKHQHERQPEQQITGECESLQLTARPLPTVRSQRLHEKIHPPTFPSSPAPPTFLSHYTGSPSSDDDVPAAPGANRGAGLKGVTEV